MSAPPAPPPGWPPSGMLGADPSPGAPPGAAPSPPGIAGGVPWVSAAADAESEASDAVDAVDAVDVAALVFPDAESAAKALVTGLTESTSAPVTTAMPALRSGSCRRSAMVFPMSSPLVDTVSRKPLRLCRFSCAAAAVYVIPHGEDMHALVGQDPSHSRNV